MTLFSNGAAEDRAVLARLGGRPEVAGRVGRGDLRLAGAPGSPAALARLIGGFDAVVAHRLHACILGYAYARPVVGLGWDRKVESFFRSVGCADRFVPSDALSAEGIAAATERALRAGIDGDVHARVLAETWEGVERLLAAGSIPRPADRPPPNPS